MNAIQERILDDARLEDTIGRILGDKAAVFRVFGTIKNGHVHLAGSVNGEGMKRKIESQLQKLPGVQFVTNHIRTNAWEEKRTVAHF